MAERAWPAVTLAMTHSPISRASLGKQSVFTPAFILGRHGSRKPIVGREVSSAVSAAPRQKGPRAAKINISVVLNRLLLDEMRRAGIGRQG